MIVNQETNNHLIETTLRCDNRGCTGSGSLTTPDTVDVKEFIENKGWVFAGKETFCPKCSVVQVRD